MSYIVVTEHYPNDPRMPVWWHVETRPLPTPLDASLWVTTAALNRQKNHPSRLTGKTFAVKVLEEKDLVSEIAKERRERDGQQPLSEFQKVEKLRKLIDKIATHNKGRWYTTVTITETGYEIKVVDSKHHHYHALTYNTLTFTHQATLDDAITQLALDLPDAVNRWGCVMPDGMNF